MASFIFLQWLSGYHRDRVVEEDSTVFAGESQTDDVSDADETLHAGRVMRPPSAQIEAGTPTSVPSIDKSISEETPRGVKTDEIRRQPSQADSSNPTNSGVERTFHAMAALELSTLFGHSFGRTTFGITPKYRVKMTQANAQSTRGGALARQSILLYVDGNDLQNIVIGFVESAKQRAELRSYALMNRIFEERYRRGFDMVETEYEKLLTRIREFADVQGINVRTQHELARFEQPSPRTSDDKSAGIQLKQVVLLLLGVLLIGVGIGYALAG